MCVIPSDTQRDSHLLRNSRTDGSHRGLAALLDQEGSLELLREEGDFGQREWHHVRRQEEGRT